MPIVKNQDKPITVGVPVEIDKACNDIREQLAVMPWLERPYLIAERFYRKERGKAFYYPETYVGGDDNKGYARLTPDNDFKGRSFFVIGDGSIDFEPSQYNFIKYQVGIIFSVNLELIDEVKLDQGLFTQELIREVRRILTDTMIYHEFGYEIVKESRDLKRVFREFVLDDIELYNRAPMQCFRFDLLLTLQEECN